MIEHFIGHHEDLERSLFRHLCEFPEHSLAIDLEPKHFSEPGRYGAFLGLRELGRQNLPFVMRDLQVLMRREGFPAEGDWTRAFSSNRSTPSGEPTEVVVKRLNYYATSLRDLAVRKEYAQWSSNNLEKPYDLSLSLKNLIVDHGRELAKLQKEVAGDIDPSASGIVERMKGQPPVSYFSSGLDGIDKHVRGLRHGHLWVISAPYKSYKTRITLNMIARQLEEGRSAMYVALEDEDYSYIDRLTSIIDDIDCDYTESGAEVPLDLVDKVNTAKEQVSTLPFRVYDAKNGVHNWEYFPTLVASDKLRFGKLDVVVLDYVQGWSTSYDDLQKIVPMLLKVCAEEHIALIVISQMNNNDIRSARIGGAATEGILLTKATGDLGAACHVGLELHKEPDVDDEILVRLKVARHGPGNQKSWLQVRKESGKILDCSESSRLMKYLDPDSVV